MIAEPPTRETGGRECKNPPCTCSAGDDGYCCDFCRETAFAEALVCKCEHPNCIGFIEEDLAL